MFYWFVIVPTHVLSPLVKKKPLLNRGLFKNNSSLAGSFYLFLNKKWLFDKIYNIHLFGQLTLNSGLQIGLKLFDKGIIEYFGPRNLSTGVQQSILMNKNIQSGKIYNYIIDFFLGFIFLTLSLFGFLSHLNVFLPLTVPCLLILFFFNNS
jgi:hypothetical protein